jgi:hypothetical protein
MESVVRFLTEQRFGPCSPSAKDSQVLGATLTGVCAWFQCTRRMMTMPNVGLERPPAKLRVAEGVHQRAGFAASPVDPNRSSFNFSRSGHR